MIPLCTLWMNLQLGATISRCVCICGVMGSERGVRGTGARVQIPTREIEPRHHGGTPRESRSLHCDLIGIIGREEESRNFRIVPIPA